jgi:hypothetical protein
LDFHLLLFLYNYWINFFQELSAAGFNLASSLFHLGKVLFDQVW